MGLTLDQCNEKLINYANGHSIASISDKAELQSILGVSYKSCYLLARKENKTPLAYFNTQLDTKLYRGVAQETQEEFSNNPYVEKEDTNSGEKDIYAVDEYADEEDSPITSSTQKEPAPEVGMFDSTIDFVKTGWYIIIWLIFLYFLLKSIIYIFSFMYDVWNSSRMIYLQVTMPRLDSRSDREVEKDISKDMKEKIGRMAQVYRNLHKLWSLNVWDGIMSYFFTKPKINIIYHYDKDELKFIVATYPEYRSILESAISAQYADSIVESLNNFEIYNRKYSDIIPLRTTKSNLYPIRTFKQLEDDPINNVLDSISRLPWEDSFTIISTLKPRKWDFNVKAQYEADGLYKKDISYNDKKWFWWWVRSPISFLINGPTTKMISRMAPWADKWDAYTRMTKAEEEAINTMADEAWKPAFDASLYLIASSDNKKRLSNNIETVISAYSIYKDEYNNELDQPEQLADLLGFIFKPMRRFATIFSLIKFFWKANTFTINELSSIYHFPDGVFNRSSAITRAEYKMVQPPQNLPRLWKENGYIMTWVVAERYKKGKISAILRGRDHWAIWTKEIEEEIIDKQWKKRKLKKRVTGLKCFKDGIFLGINVYKNTYTPIYMKRKDRTRHHYVIWKSGWGKSVYISSLARQDIWNGDGVCVIDPHGDLVEDIMQYIPKERAKDIIYFDAGNEDRPMGLNLYDIIDINQADRVVNDATEIFIKMFGNEIFGPRIQEYFKYGSLTLLEDLEDGATLLDVPRLFTDEGYREYKITKVKNPMVRNFWEKTYNAMGDREKQEIIPYFTSKFVSFNTNRLIRNIIWQTKSAFNFRNIMDEGKILLINLSKGKIWEMNAQLLGMILVSQIYTSAMSRADTPEDERRDFFLYVDEFQNFVTGTFADILSEARKYHLALIMAHQYVWQLESEGGWAGKDNVKEAVFGNVGTMQSFKVGAPDAEFLEKEYAPVLSSQDIVGIANYKVYIKLNIDNATSRVFNMDTIWTQDYQSKKIADILKEYSAKKHGRNRKFVDAEIQARLGMLEDDDEDSLLEDDNKKSK